MYPESTPHPPIPGAWEPTKPNSLQIHLWPRSFDLLDAENTMHVGVSPLLCYPHITHSFPPSRLYVYRSTADQLFGTVEALPRRSLYCPHDQRKTQSIHTSIIRQAVTQVFTFIHTQGVESDGIHVLLNNHKCAEISPSGSDPVPIGTISNMEQEKEIYVPSLIAGVHPKSVVLGPVSVPFLNSTLFFKGSAGWNIFIVAAQDSKIESFYSSLCRNASINSPNRNHNNIKDSLSFCSFSASCSLSVPGNRFGL